MLDAVRDAMAPGVEPPGGESASPLRVLVVDDDEADREVVRRALARGRVRAVIDEATREDEAFGMLTSGAYDCVLLDHNLPDTDGFTVLARLQDEGVTVPVVMLTGQGDDDTVAALMRAGATDYLSKERLTPERLAASLRYAVRLSRASRAAAAAQEELRRSSDRARFLADASRALAGSLDVDATLATVARLAVPTLGEFCLIYLAHADGSRRAAAAAHADPALAPLADDVARRFEPRVDDPGSAVARSVRDGLTVVLHEVGPEHLASVAGGAADAALFTELGARAAMVVPLVARGAVLGAAAFVRTGDGGFAPEVVTLAEDLAQRAAAATDNARLFAAAERARGRAEEAAARTERLQHVTASLAEADTADAVDAAVMAHGVLAVGAYAGCVALLVDGGEALELRTAAGYPEAACMTAGRRFPIGAGMPIAEAARSAAAVYVESPADWAARYGGGHVPPAAAQSRSQAWAALPLSVAGRVAGALLWTFDAPRRFAAEDRGLMEAVARQAAQAMERARLRDAERRARAEAEEANRAKSEFLARMSHDLRTPLNAIAGYAQLVEMGVHGPVTEGQREAMSRISRAQSHLLALINDILSFARLEAGQVQFEVTDVPLAEALADVAALVEPQAAAKGLAFVPPPALPGVRVRADRERLQQVLGNLLGNAVKFTPPGGVVTVDAAATPERVTVAVRDTGIGIDPAKLAAIFEPFVQLGGEPAERQGSLGLGLAISRELVRAMGGTITAESRLGDGAAFTVSLARADAPQLPNAR